MFFTQRQVDRYTAVVRNTVQWAYANHERVMGEADLQAALWKLGAHLVVQERGGPALHLDGGHHV